MMSRETFQAFLDTVALESTNIISFVGMGEPMLNPMLPEFVSMAKARYPKTPVWVTTNGTRLGKGMVDELVTAGLDILDISFNGLKPKEYENNMRGADFQQTVTHIERLAEKFKKDGIKTVLQINYVLTQDNIDREGEIKNFWRKRGISHFRAQQLHTRGGFIKLPGAPCADPGLGNRLCKIFKMIHFITWDGNVLYCCHDVERTHILGNIREKEWGHIIARKAVIEKERQWPSMCSSCTDMLRFSLSRMIDKKIIENIAAFFYIFRGKKDKKIKAFRDVQRKRRS